MDGEFEARALAVLDEALEQPESARTAWLDTELADEPALRSRVHRLLERAGRASLRTGMAPLLAAHGDHPERIGAYRITGLIGQGGMGAVYRGERAAGDFEHVAAIKLIRPGALSGELVERFRRERQTLARLAHPHIARLFDGGETGAGQPYLVMECVDGRPLDAWLEQEQPSRAARLTLFGKICAAVAYAHRNLIVHRDLTPPNILVDRAGEPKLIDFGIARPVDEAGGDAPAQTATPGFAAPERLAGGAATTLGDIYALGKLLDRLAGDGADQDLRAIIGRAAAEDPDARYPTVEALIDDLDRLRDGRAVEARGGGAGYRVRRFVARNLLAVSAGTVALLLLVAALVTTLIANRRAEVARVEAEQRFDQTRTLAKSMMFDVYDAVGAVPGSTQARFVLARTAQQYLDSLAADRNAPADIRLEVGEGYFRLARVVGFTGGGSLGRREDGARLFDRAQRILTEVHQAAPERADARIALGHLLSVRSGERLYGGGDSKVARREAREARALIEGVAKPDARAAGALAGAYLYEGDSWGWDNDIPAAGRVYEQGIRVVQAMPAALRDSEEVRSAMSGLLRQSGAVYREARQTGPAIARLSQAVAVSRQLVASSNGSPAAQRKLLTTLWALADMHRSVGQMEPALAAITESYGIAKTAARAGGSDSGPRESVALTGLVLAQVQSARGAHPAALAAAREAVAIRRDLAAKSGGNKGARITLAVGLKDVVPVHRAAGDVAGACGALREADAIMGDYAAAGTLSEYDSANNLKPVRAALRSCSA